MRASTLWEIAFLSTAAAIAALYLYLGARCSTSVGSTKPAHGVEAMP